MTDVAAVLQVSEARSGYGDLEVLHGISLKVQPSEVVALIGPNGSGKSTSLKMIFGLLPVWSGEVKFQGSNICNIYPPVSVRRGICYAPQGSRVFGELTVEENLEIGGYILDNDTIDTAKERGYELFPRLHQRRHQRARSLSGGEKQMLSLARALMVKPKLLLLDEPSLGLSPNLTRDALRRIQEVNKQLDTAILIVEQSVTEVLRIASRAYVIRNGHIVEQGRSEKLQDSDRLQRAFLTSESPPA